MARFCAAPDLHERLAVLGVFTAEENGARREAVRTWLRDATHAKPLLARFVARGAGKAPVLMREAREYGDVVLLEGPAEMSRSNGPLLTLILWLECALRAWPHAALIGKADDDVWVHVDATAAHLQGSLDALRMLPQVADNELPLMYWGLMETYGWSLTSHRPMGVALGGRLHGPRIDALGGGRERCLCAHGLACCWRIVRHLLEGGLRAQHHPLPRQHEELAQHGTLHGHAPMGAQASLRLGHARTERHAAL